MIKSMTGFGSQEIEIRPYGKISVEMRSSNHKFIETVLHLPEGFLSLEDEIKKIIEGRIKRGRVFCLVNISGLRSSGVSVNEPLLRNYLKSLRAIKSQFALQGEVGLDTLIHLPGVLSVEEKRAPKEKIYPALKSAVREAVEELVETRQKEGKALFVYLIDNARALKKDLAIVKVRFKRLVKDRVARCSSDEERSVFLKETDIGEEVQRLEFHLRNFTGKLLKKDAVGKELDFIAQEMQREANTSAAKSFDPAISARVVKIKSRIEKIREQVQNVE
ncbi:MAG TPA: YicC/YloC family endoribonuclease [Candidatus Margulisiibacteriota bacterium]|nr:YicC/YloC family endoribonuclease [Candidatus Margulisiibacteriota bacterium]